MEETYGVQPLLSYSGYVFVERHDGGYFLTKGIVFFWGWGVWFVSYGEGKRQMGRKVFLTADTSRESNDERTHRLTVREGNDIQKDLGGAFTNDTTFRHRPFQIYTSPPTPSSYPATIIFTFYPFLRVIAFIYFVQFFVYT